MTGELSGDKSARLESSSRPIGKLISTNADRRIVFVVNTDDPFWDACRQGLKEGAKHFKLADQGLQAEMEVPTEP